MLLVFLLIQLFITNVILIYYYFIRRRLFDPQGAIILAMQ